METKGAREKESERACARTLVLIKTGPPVHDLVYNFVNSFSIFTCFIVIIAEFLRILSPDATDQ